MTLVEIEDNRRPLRQPNSDELFRIKGLQKRILNKTLKALEEENVLIFPKSLADAKDIEDKQMILQEIDGAYHSSNVAGFLGYGDEQLIIHSRFDPKGTRFFSEYLLEKVISVPNIFDLPLSADQKGGIFDFLSLLFPYRLKAAMQKGVFRQYVHCRKNDSNVKGSIDIARHIRRNIPFMGNIAYDQRMLSSDNHLTELMRHTIEFIRRKRYGNTLLSKVRDEVLLIINATPSYRQQERRKIIEANLKNPVRHAYFHEYLALQHLCLAILNHQKHQMGRGSQRVYGILFDFSWVWEEYVNSLIGRDFYHPDNRTQTYPQNLFDHRQEIYPDFISRNAKQRVIADAKYRPKDNIGRDDYFQLLAYMFRFGSKTGYYLYPEQNEAQVKELHLNNGSTFENNVVPRKDVVLKKHGLRISSKKSSYDAFVREMHLNELAFVQGISP